MENVERVQKILSQQGIMSRRKAEKLIEEGRIKVNGRPATLGTKINRNKDLVSIDNVGIDIRYAPKKYYIALHKPRGYITTLDDEFERKKVTDLVSDIDERLYPVGRLDKDSEGLIIMTNDGDFANLLMHPSGEIEKVYRVTVKSEVKPEQQIKLMEGVVIDGRKTLPAKVKIIEEDPGRTVLRVTIREGRNRQVRKMFEAVGLSVARLKRISIGGVKLGMLKAGEHRDLTSKEIASLKKQEKAK